MTTLRIYQGRKKIDEVSMGKPPIHGAKLYAGKPGRLLVVEETVLNVEDGFYDVYCKLEKS